MSQQYYSYSAESGSSGYSYEVGSSGLVGSNVVVSSVSSGLSGGSVLVGSSGVSGGSLLVESSGLSGGSVLVGSSGSNAVVSQIAGDLLGGANVSSGSVVVSSSEASGVLEAAAFSAVEQAILRASNPVEFNESESLTVNGQTGLWINRNEIVNWRGVIPITQYVINEDVNPEVIRKRTEQQLVYEQEVAIRYLRPPTPPPPGEIIIKQEKNIPTPPAPPLVIRQVPARPETPAPLVVREAPPRAPAAVGAKLITISGKRLPPPPRKVVIERLAPLPSKPQAVMIERWLPYAVNKRRVIFQKNLEADPVIPKPRNVVIQWEAPAVQIKQEFKNLGVIRANPVEYVERYGASLKVHQDLPEFVRVIRPPSGVVLAAEYQAPSLLELEGDVQALNLIDLDREGLSEYRAYLSRFGSSGSASVSVGGGSSLLAELFSSIDSNSSGRISRSEAEKLLLRLNSRLGRNYGENEANVFFRALDANGDGVIDVSEFRNALSRFV